MERHRIIAIDNTYDPNGNLALNVQGKRPVYTPCFDLGVVRQK